MTHPATSGRTVAVNAADGLITITPQPWQEPNTPVEAQSLSVRGGTMSFRPDGDLPSSLIIVPEEAQLWLREVYGEPVAEAVNQATMAEAVSAETVTDPDADPTLPPTDADLSVVVTGEDAGLLGSLGCLARAMWYRRWWPSGDPADPDRSPTLDPGLLDLDQGTLAWECEWVLDSEEVAEHYLGRSTGVLLALLGKARDQTGALRRYLDERLSRSVDAALDLLDESATDVAALAAHRERGDAAEAAIRAAMTDLDRLTPDADLHDLLAPAAGEDLSEGDAVRLSTVDWALVPVRSVSGREFNVSLRAAQSPAGLRLTVTVEAGDNPVPTLTAYVHADPTQTLAARLDLNRTGRRYTGSVVAPMLDMTDLDRLNVHVVGPDIGPSPYFPELPLPWLNPQRLDHAAADRDLVRRVLGEYLAAADALSGRPLLCELNLA